MKFILSALFIALTFHSYADQYNPHTQKYENLSPANPNNYGFTPSEQTMSTPKTSNDTNIQIKDVYHSSIPTPTSPDTPSQNAILKDQNKSHSPFDQQTPKKTENKATNPQQ
jgi:hypothetical protein